MQRQLSGERVVQRRRLPGVLVAIGVIGDDRASREPQRLPVDGLKLVDLVVVDVGDHVEFRARREPRSVPRSDDRSHEVGEAATGRGHSVRGDLPRVTLVEIWAPEERGELAEHREVRGDPVVETDSRRGVSGELETSPIYI